MKIVIRFFYLIACIGLLTACGGGGGGGAATTPSPPATTQSAEGLWSGTLTGTSSTHQAYALFSSNGDYYIVYLNGGVYDAFATGTSATFSSAIASTDYASFDLTAPLASVASGSFSGTVSTKNTLAGTINYTGGSPAPDTLALRYDSQYDSGSSLSSTAGTYTYNGNGVTPIYSFSVATNGAITGSTSAGCQFTGQLAIRSSSKNLYDLSLTTGTGCAFMQTLNGLATYVTLPSDTKKTLFLIATKRNVNPILVFFAAGQQ